MTASVSNDLTADHDQLDQLLSKFYAATVAGDPEVSYSTLDLFWARLAVHIRSEHLHLFPAVLEAAQRNKSGNHSSEEIESVIVSLRRDHEFFMNELAGAVVALRELTTSDDKPTIIAHLSEVREKIERVQRKLIQHNLNEEQQIYLCAETLLTSAEQQSLETQIRSDLANWPARFTLNLWKTDRSDTS